MVRVQRTAEEKEHSVCLLYALDHFSLEVCEEGLPAKSRRRSVFFLKRNLFVICLTLVRLWRPWSEETRLFYAALEVYVQRTHVHVKRSLLFYARAEQKKEKARAWCCIASPFNMTVAGRRRREREKTKRTDGWLEGNQSLSLSLGIRADRGDRFPAIVSSCSALGLDLSRQ